MITGPAGPRNARRDGYLQALEGQLPELPPMIEEVSDYNEMGGYQGMQSLLAKHRPDAIFAANDLMAIGAMKAIREAGLRIPQDVAVVGFDDIPAAQLVTPALTTIYQDQEGMGRKAAQLLIERLEGRAPAQGLNIEMAFELHIRESA